MPAVGRRHSATDRVRRGGSWDNDAGNLRAANRDDDDPADADDNLGFRCCSSRTKSSPMGRLHGRGSRAPGPRPAPPVPGRPTRRTKSTWPRGGAAASAAPPRGVSPLCPCRRGVSRRRPAASRRPMPDCNAAGGWQPDRCRPPPGLRTKSRLAAAPTSPRGARFRQGARKSKETTEPEERAMLAWASARAGAPGVPLRSASPRSG